MPSVRIVHINKIIFSLKIWFHYITFSPLCSKLYTVLNVLLESYPNDQSVIAIYINHFEEKLILSCSITMLTVLREFMCYKIMWPPNSHPFSVFCPSSSPPNSAESGHFLLGPWLLHFCWYALYLGASTGVLWHTCSWGHSAPWNPSSFLLFPFSPPYCKFSRCWLQSRPITL